MSGESKEIRSPEIKELKELKVKDIEEIYKIYRDNSLTSVCRKNTDESFGSFIYKTSGKDNFICDVKKEDKTIAEIYVEWMDIDTVYIASVKRLDNSNKTGKKIVDIPLGKILIFQALFKAKKRGATKVDLLPLDTGTNKLFKYYQSLGFDCYNEETGTIIKTSEPTYYNCNYMTAKINDVLKFCCL